MPDLSGRKKRNSQFPSDISGVIRQAISLARLLMEPKMSLEYVGWALRQDFDHPVAKLVFIGFCNSFNIETYDFEYRPTYLAKFTGLSEDEIDVIFEHLVLDGWVDRKFISDNIAVYDVNLRRGVDHLGTMIRDENAPPKAVFQPEVKLYIYVISAGKIVKIGISREPEKRLASLKASSPNKCLEIAYTQKDGASVITLAERLAHERLNHIRSHNEWFLTTPDVAIRAVKHAMASAHRRNGQ